MIKLIATDVDGTLVKDSAKEAYPELIELFKDLEEQGIIIAVASGRQFQSIRRMFRELGNRIVYVAENGAYIFYQEEILGLTTMDPIITREIIQDFRETPSDCHLFVSTPDKAYVECKDEYFVDLLVNSYCNEIEIVEDLLALELDIIKISLFRKDGVHEIVERELVPKWEKRVKTCYAGKEWLDLMDASIDKGKALQVVQNRFGITREETMAFGDNSNDVSLLMQAEESYAVENAVPETKAVAKYNCPTYHEKGVYQILKNKFKNCNL